MTRSRWVVLLYPVDVAPHVALVNEPSQSGKRVLAPDVHQPVHPAAAIEIGMHEVFLGDIDVIRVDVGSDRTRALHSAKGKSG